jgi:uncharacterized protein YbjQ (UPF0145 family)
MAAECVICGKAKKIMMADFPLSEEIKDERICLTCNQRLKKMLETRDPAVFRQEQSYFQTMFYQPQLSDQAKKLLDNYFEIGKSFSGEASLDQLVRKEMIKRKREEEAEFEKALDFFMITTESGFEGYRISRYLDVIFEEGMVGSGLSMTFKSFAGLFSSSKNQEVKEVADLISQLKESMKMDLIRKAHDLGANGLIGLDFGVAITEQASTILVSAKATAVKVYPLV